MPKKHTTNADPLSVRHTFDAPLREVSGICLRRDEHDRAALVAVGDRAAKIAWVRLPEDDAMWTPQWRTADISQLKGSEIPADDPQLEAICADGAGRVLLLQEWPPRAELIDPDQRRVIASIRLEVDNDDELAESWADEDSSHGEGVIMLPGGHLLIAKEKDPPAFIEFGPRGGRSQGLGSGGALADGAAWPIEPGKHRFTALAVWQPDKKLSKACKDFSDIDVGPDGCLYLLSDQSASIARIDDLLAGGGQAGVTQVWRLPDVDGKPEGLSFAGDGSAIVALDRSKPTNNLLLLEPTIAAGSADESPRAGGR
jgi:hypothetical protein